MEVSTYTTFGPQSFTPFMESLSFYWVFQVWFQISCVVRNNYVKIGKYHYCIYLCILRVGVFVI